MTRVSSPDGNRHLDIQRTIADLKGSKRGPLLIITAGMHGNESEGVFAAHDFIQSLADAEGVRGRVIALAGNLKALEQGKRFIDIDLNRIWNGDEGSAHEFTERDELWSHITSAGQESLLGKLVHIDLHATSGRSTPFIAMGKSDLNQRLARKLPSPTITELEKVLKTPLLSKISSMGHASFAFEGGAIGDSLTYRNHIAMLWVLMDRLNMLPKDFTAEPKFQTNFLERQSPFPERTLHISHVHRISEGDHFEMRPGYANFQRVEKDEWLGHDASGQVRAPHSGLIFMPLYQPNGSEGFFILKPPSR